MTKTVDVLEEIKKVLRNNLSDPNKDRKTEWIFANTTPKTSNQFPRILIEPLDAQKEGYSIGQTDRFHRQRIQISIQLGKSNKFDIDKDGNLETSQYVKQWLAERCDEIIQANQSNFRNLGNDIHSVLPDSSNPISPSGTNQINNEYILRRNRS